MKYFIIGIGELVGTNDRLGVIKTFALGSCVAVILLDPGNGAVGMAHIALPDSKINPSRAQHLPGYFADTGISTLLRELARFGSSPNGQGLRCKLLGGASIMDQNAVFNIGKRNLEAIRGMLSPRGIPVVAEDVGGTITRTVSVAVDTGKVTLSTPGRPDRHI